MIRVLGVALAAQLQAQGVPFAVIDGPEPTTTTTWGRERIVIEYDADGTDSIAKPTSQSLGSTRRFNALEACKVTIYARAVATGSLVAEHRDRAKRVRDQVLTALEYLAATRKNRFAPGTGRLITPPDLKGSEIAGGAVYEQKFVFERGVIKQNWAGDAIPTGTIAHVKNKDTVTAPDGTESVAAGA